MDEFVLKHYNKEFDSEGSLASKGIPSKKIINNFLQNPFFEKPHQSLLINLNLKKL